MNITITDNGIYQISRDNGDSFELTANEVSLLCNQMNKHDLRFRIEDSLREMDGDTISLEKYPYTFEELIDEIYVDLEDEVDYGNSVSDDDIEEKILDTADFYEMLTDEEDD